MDDRERRIRQRLKDVFPHYARKCLKIRAKAPVVVCGIPRKIIPFELNQAQTYLHKKVYSRRTVKPCRQPAMANGRCRMHGGKAGAPRGNTNALKHGLYTREAIARRRYIRELIRESCKTIEALQ